MNAIHWNGEKTIVNRHNGESSPLLEVLQVNGYPVYRYTVERFSDGFAVHYERHISFDTLFELSNMDGEKLRRHWRSDKVTADVVAARDEYAFQFRRPNGTVASVVSCVDKDTTRSIMEKYFRGETTTIGFAD